MSLVVMCEMTVSDSMPLYFYRTLVHASALTMAMYRKQECISKLVRWSCDGFELLAWNNYHTQLSTFLLRTAFKPC